MSDDSIASKDGHGIILPSVSGVPSQKDYVAFRSEQIKSAIGNVGAYGQRPVTADEAARLGMTQDEANNAQSRGDIRFSMAAPAEQEPFDEWFGDSKVVDAVGGVPRHRC